MEGAPRLLEHLSDDDAEHFAEVRELLDVANVAYEIDSTLVRGLDYYTRTVFEFTSDALGAQSGVGGGGRYDGLVEQLGGPPTPGIGWAAGVERMLLAGDPQPGGRRLRRAVRGASRTARRARRAAFGILTEARSAGLTRPDGARGALAEGPARPRKRARRPLRRDRGGPEDGAEGHGGGGQERIATDTVVHAVLRAAGSSHLGALRAELGAALGAAQRGRATWRVPAAAASRRRCSVAVGHRLDGADRADPGHRGRSGA